MLSGPKTNPSPDEVLSIEPTFGRVRTNRQRAHNTTKHEHRRSVVVSGLLSLLSEYVFMCVCVFEHNIRQSRTEMLRTFR